MNTDFVGLALAYICVLHSACRLAIAQLQNNRTWSEL